MEQRKKHLQTLVYFASVDKDFRTEEKDFIKQVGLRFNLNEEEINIIIDSKVTTEPTIPDLEVERYVLFDDLLNLIAVDKKITADEEKALRKIATKFGFTEQIADDILKKLKRHIELGFDSNQISHSIKNSVFSLINNINSYGKHSM